MARGKNRVTKSILFTVEMADEIDWLSDYGNPNSKFHNFGEAVRKLVGVGLLVVKQEGKIESGELIEQLNGLIKDDKMMAWIQNLSSGQRIGLKQMISMQEELEQKML